MNMDTLPLHPKLVHLPIALAVLMPLITSGLLVAWWRGWFQKRTWAVAVALQAVLLLSGVLAMSTGEVDEDRVERIVPKNAIHAHEEAGEVFVWGSGLVLVLSFLPLLLRSPRLARITGLATVAGTFVVLGLGYRVGEAGGALVYRHGAGAAFATPGGGAPPAAMRGRDDDR